MRWLAHRGGAAHHRAWSARGKDTPVAVAIGADPATILSAVLPLPETVSELRFSGVLRGERPRIAPALTVPLHGSRRRGDRDRGVRLGDGDGAGRPLWRPHRLLQQRRIVSRSCASPRSPSRRDPIYLTTFTGRPPDEPSVIGAVLNDLALPTMRRQMPEIVDVWLPPEACSYRMAIISIRKSYPGQARRVMMGLWGMLPQFNYTKTIIVVDDDIDVRDWNDVAWALATRMDAGRDSVVVVEHADRLSRFRLARVGTRRQARPRRDQKDRRRDHARMGPHACHVAGGEKARRRHLAEAHARALRRRRRMRVRIANGGSASRAPIARRQTGVLPNALWGGETPPPIEPFLR